VSFDELFFATRLSLFIAGVACVIACAIAVPLAFFLSRSRRAWLGIVDVAMLLPLVLPPTVIGYLFVVLLGRRGWVGSLLFDTLGYTMLFRIEAAIIAAAVVALPLVYLPARSAFAGVDPDLLDQARLNTNSSRAIFQRVSLPLAWPTLLAGTVLAFARALGEFGATVMVFGIQPARTTLPISVYAKFESGTLPDAWPAVVVLVLLSVLTVLVYRKLR
jgi:molybdate transport system permease protein